MNNTVQFTLDPLRAEDDQLQESKLNAGQVIKDIACTTAAVLKTARNHL